MAKTFESSVGVPFGESDCKLLFQESLGHEFEPNLLIKKLNRDQYTCIRCWRIFCTENDRVRETLTLGAQGVVPQSFGSLVVNALDMAPPCEGGVLELLVAVIAVIFPQRHLSPSRSIGQQILKQPLFKVLFKKSYLRKISGKIRIEPQLFRLCDCEFLTLKNEVLHS